MARPRMRVCLQEGLKLDLNRLDERGFIRFDCNIGTRGIAWNDSYWGEKARGFINADMTNPYDAWFTITLGETVQRITLEGIPRHFGGRQWFFLCPATGRRATVLWKPPGASKFCSRKAWGRRVAYATQFLGRIDRAHHAKAKLNNRLCSLGGYEPDDWDFPPKPKGMRWKTYQRHERKFDRQDDVLNEGLAELVAKFQRWKIV